MISDPVRLFVTFLRVGWCTRGGQQALMDELQGVNIDYLVTMCCEAEVCVAVLRWVSRRVSAPLTSHNLNL